MARLPPYAFQEVRIDLDSKPLELCADLLIPSRSSKSAFSSNSSRPVPKRRRIDAPKSLYDETVFESQHLASESAIHFRPNIHKHHQSPRSIVWRVLENRKVLELQNVDIEQDRGLKDDPMVTLRFTFEKSIRPHCIGFAEAVRGSSNSSSLIVFVVCTDGELHTLKIDKSAWLKSDWLAEAPGDWHQSTAPSALSYRTPHRMLVAGERDIWLAVTDGGLIHLTRGLEQSASSWEQTQLSDGGWKSSFRIFRNNAVRHEGIDYDAKAALQIMLSPDARHLWTVCVDRLVRVWSLKDARIIQTFDMTLDATRDFEKPADHLLDPTHTRLMQIVPLLTHAEVGEGYTVVLFSPSTRRFRFVTIRDPAFGYSDAYPDVDFPAPLVENIGSSAFNVDNFIIQQEKDHRKHTWHFWILMRSGHASYTLYLHFNPRSAARRLQNEWHQHWAAAYKGLNSATALDEHCDSPIHVDIDSIASGPVDLAQTWLQFILHPGRFSRASLETGLAVYNRALSGSKAMKPMTPGDERDIQVRIAETVGSTAILEFDRTGSPQTKAFLKANADQWATFYGIIKNLQAQREHIMSINIDPAHEQAWTVMADFVGPLRTLSELEMVYHNRRILAESDTSGSKTYLQSPGTFHDPNDIQLLGKVVWISSWLRSKLRPSFLQTFQAALDVDLALSSQDRAQTRISDVYDTSGFIGQINDEEYNQFIDHMNRIGGFQLIRTTLFEAVGQLLKQDSAQARKQEPKHFVHYGVASIVRSAQELTETGRGLLLDLLVLVVWMSSELEAEDLPADFDGGDVFSLLMIQYKQYSLLRWLLNTRSKSSARGRSEFYQRTLHESLFRGDPADIAYPSTNQAALLTFLAQEWALAMTAHGNFEAVTPYIVSVLLKLDDQDSAVICMRFLPDTPWATYLKARTFLVSGDLGQASLLFNKAAEQLSGNFNVEQYDTADLLALDERMYFNQGKPLYCQHIVSLFDKARAFTYVSEFAEEALTSSTSSQLASSDRTDLLSRLFTSYLKTSRFELAFSTLARYSDTALRKSALQSLIRVLLETPATATRLLTLPFDGKKSLAVEADEILSSFVDKTTIASMETGQGVEYHKLIYAWRLLRKDYRGAALITWEHLRKLRAARKFSTRRLEDAVAVRLDQDIAEAFLIVINCLTLIEPNMAWMLVRPSTDHQVLALTQTRRRRGEVPKAERRKVVTLDDVRREWQLELDERADEAAGRFPLMLGADEHDFGDSVSNFVSSGAGAMSGGTSIDVDVFAS